MSMNPNIDTSLFMLKKEEESAIHNAKVIAVSSSSAIVEIKGDKIKAKKAFSCFVEPEPGDTVICCKSEDGHFYILGILERKQNNKNMIISFPSDAALEAREGNINVVSRGGITMASESLNFFSKNTVHKSCKAAISFDDVTASGTSIQASYKKLTFISHLINTVARQVINRFKGYVRHTEDNDQVKSGHMTRSVKGLFAVDTKHTIMVSRESTKIDGEKILMG